MKNNKKKKITKTSTFADVLIANPKAALVLLRYGLHCATCHLAAEETIEQGAKAHGLTEKELKKMIEEINKA